MALVYRLICKPTGEEYIGFTSRTLKQRWARHKTAAKHHRENGRLQNSLRKYGPDAFDVHVVAEGLSDEGALQLEATLIREWGTLSPAGLNLTTGGDKVEFTEEVKEKIRTKAGPHLRRKETQDSAQAAKRANRLGVFRPQDRLRARLLPEVLRLRALGMSQQSIADHLGVSQMAVCKWLRHAADE